jgi:peptidoglycan hydrolase CwlO-like protein
MKTNISIQKVIVAGVLLVSIIFIGLLYQGKTKFKKQLSDEKRKSEILLSEKLSLDKAIKNYQFDITGLQNKTSGLNKLIDEANINVQNKNDEINRLKTANKGSLKNLKEKNAELENQMLQLNEQLSKSNNSLAQVKSENEALNNQIFATSKKADELERDNNILRELFSYNYRMEALKGKNEKLTVNSKRTNKLFVGFDLPGNISNDIHFKIITPEGKELSSDKDLAANIKITENGDGLLASSSQNSAGSKGTKRVEMSYKPSQKMAKGIYQFNLYNEDRFLGSTQLRLK